MTRQPRSEALARDLSVVELDGPPVQHWLGPRLIELLGCEATLIHGVGFADAGFDLGEVTLTGGQHSPALDRAVARVRDCALRGFYSAYDPRAIDPLYSNRVVVMPSARQVADHGLPSALLRGRHARDALELGLQMFRAWSLPMYARWGQVDGRHLRVLLCEARRMIGYVAALQPTAFSRQAQHAMAGLVPPMRRRFAIEERLPGGPAPLSLGEALLEELPTAAYLVDPRRRIVAANAAARARLAADRTCVERLRRAVGGFPDADLAVVELTNRGLPRHALVLERRTGGKVPQAEALARRHGLTKRELEVVERLGCGMTNRAIAAALGCSERTVETHVSRILAKTDCASRSELVATLWSSTG